MNEFRFDHLKNRRRQRLPRPILYVGVAIILLAFFSIKWFQRAGDSAPATGGAPPETAVTVLPRGAVPGGPLPVKERPVADAARPAPAAAEGEQGGILSLDGSGNRIRPPRLISGQRPELPVSLSSRGPLDDPRIYVRVGKDGLVAELKLVSGSGSAEVDRLVLDALGGYTFEPAKSAGQPVEFSSVVTVPLRTKGGVSP
jgi:hypothetical protein